MRGVASMGVTASHTLDTLGAVAAVDETVGRVSAIDERVGGVSAVDERVGGVSVAEDTVGGVCTREVGGVSRTTVPVRGVSASCMTTAVGVVSMEAVWGVGAAWTIICGMVGVVLGRSDSEMMIGNSTLSRGREA